MARQLVCDACEKSQEETPQMRSAGNTTYYEVALSHTVVEFQVTLRDRDLCVDCYRAALRKLRSQMAAQVAGEAVL